MKKRSYLLILVLFLAIFTICGCKNKKNKENNNNNNQNNPPAVEKAEATINFSGEFTYNGNHVEVVATTNSNGTITYEYKVKGSSEYTTNRPVDAGEYSVRVSVSETDTYKACVKEFDFVINQASGQINSVSDPSKLYDGNAVTNPTVDANSNGAVTFEYKVKGSDTYSSDLPFNAGTYVVKASVAATTNYTGASCEKEFTISKASIDFANVAWVSENSYSYDGIEKEVVLNALPNGVTANYTNNKATNAGNYVATVAFTYDEANYNIINNNVESFNWSILKSTIDFSNVTWNYTGSFTYDGKEKEIKLNTEPSGVTVSYQNNKATNAGSYTAKVTLTYDEANCEIINNHLTDLNWEIEKVVIDFSNVSWVYTSSFTYDGKEKEIKLNTEPSGVTVSYQNNKATNAGSYTAKVTLTYDDANCEIINNHLTDLNWKIEKAVFDFSNVSWVYSGSFTYDGKEKEVALNAVPEGVSVTYTNNKATKAGLYNASVAFSYDSQNCEVINNSITDLVWEIAKVQIDFSNVTWIYEGAFTYDGTEKEVVLNAVPEGVSVTYNGNYATNAGLYSAGVEFGYDSDNYELINNSITSLSWEIKKIEIDFTDVYWDYGFAFTYDGEEKEVGLVNVPSSVSVTYTNNKATNAGEYTATVEFIYDSVNYEIINSYVIDLTWCIFKVQIDFKDVYWDYGFAFTYDGEEKEVVLANLPSNVSATYTNNKGTNADEYTATVEIIYDDVNYEIINYDVLDLTWYIFKGQIDLANVYWDYGFAFEYDGEEKEVILANLPSSVSATYTNNKATNAGTYVASVEFVYDSQNYELINNSIIDLEWVITKATLTAPTLTPVTGTYDSTKTLADIELPEYFRWDDETIVPQCDAEYYWAIYNIDDAIYNDLYVQYPIELEKAYINPTFPESLTVRYNSEIGNYELPTVEGGHFRYDWGSTHKVNSSIGTHTEYCPIRFFPTDGVNYNQEVAYITIIVVKGTPTPEALSVEIPYGTRLGDFELTCASTGMQGTWEWNDVDSYAVISGNYEATFTPGGNFINNYEPTTFDVAVTIVANDCLLTTIPTISGSVYENEGITGLTISPSSGAATDFFGGSITGTFAFVTTSNSHGEPLQVLFTPDETYSDICLPTLFDVSSISGVKKVTAIELKDYDIFKNNDEYAFARGKAIVTYSDSIKKEFFIDACDKITYENSKYYYHYGSYSVECTITPAVFSDETGSNITPTSNYIYFGVDTTIDSLAFTNTRIVMYIKEGVTVDLSGVTFASGTSLTMTNYGTTYMDSYSGIGYNFTCNNNGTFTANSCMFTNLVNKGTINIGTFKGTSSSLSFDNQGVFTAEAFDGTAMTSTTSSTVYNSGTLTINSVPNGKYVNGYFQDLHCVYIYRLNNTGTINVNEGSICCEISLYNEGNVNATVYGNPQNYTNTTITMKSGDIQEIINAATNPNLKINYVIPSAYNDKTLKIMLDNNLNIVIGYNCSLSSNIFDDYGSSTYNYRFFLDRNIEIASNGVLDLNDQTMAIKKEYKINNKGKIQNGTIVYNVGAVFSPAASSLNYTGYGSLVNVNFVDGNTNGVDLLTDSYLGNVLYDNADVTVDYEIIVKSGVTLTINTSLTIPENVTIVFEEGSKAKVDSSRGRCYVTLPYMDTARLIIDIRDSALAANFLDSGCTFFIQNGFHSVEDYINVTSRKFNYSYTYMCKTEEDIDFANNMAIQMAATQDFYRRMAARVIGDITLTKDLFIQPNLTLELQRNLDLGGHTISNLFALNTYSASTQYIYGYISTTNSTYKYINGKVTYCVFTESFAPSVSQFNQTSCVVDLCIYTYPCYFYNCFDASLAANNIRTITVYNIGSPDLESSFSYTKKAMTKDTVASAITEGQIIEIQSNSSDIDLGGYTLTLGYVSETQYVKLIVDQDTTLRNGTVIYTSEDQIQNDGTIDESCTLQLAE